MFTTDQFTYNKETHTLAAEASDLEMRHLTPFMPKQIEIRSTKTGMVKTFVLTHIERDEEGDTQFWKFTAVSIGTPLIAIIFND